MNNRCYWAYPNEFRWFSLVRPTSVWCQSEEFQSERPCAHPPPRSSSCSPARLFSPPLTGELTSSSISPPAPRSSVSPLRPSVPSGWGSSGCCWRCSRSCDFGVLFLRVLFFDTPRYLPWVLSPDRVTSLPARISHFGEIVICGKLNIVHYRVGCSKLVLAEDSMDQVPFEILHFNPICYGSN
jgi:hypothetical protein